MKNIPQTLVTDVKYLIRYMFKDIGIDPSRDMIEKTFVLVDKYLDQKPENMPMPDYVLEIICDEVI